MRKSLFLIFSLVTTLAYGMGQRECVDAHRKALFDWDQHETLIQESQKVPGTEKELRLIQESLNCCQQALSTCKSIEDAIANKSKHKRKRHWCTHLSKKCARDNEKFLAEIERLNTLIPELEASIAVAKKKRLQEKITQLQVEAQLLAEQGLKRGAYELRQQAISLQERDLNKEETSEEFVHLKEAVASFEKEIDDYRFRIVHPPLSEEKFSAREKERKTLFFEDLLLLNPSLFLPEIITNPLFPRALPLDGQKKLKEGGFFLYTDSFYRFLIQSEAPATTLFVKVFEQGECVHEEAIPLPCPGTSSWASYLQQGMLLAPETQLQSEFGLELRLRFVADPNHLFSLVIAQKSTHLCYRFSFSLDPEIPLYACRYAAHPPWQLDALCKPLSTPQRFRSSPPPLINHIPSSESLEEVSYPLIDQFVEEFQRDPLALARFVQNEIALIDPFLHQEHGIFYPPGIQRNPEITFLERQGSAKEQSQLLVYLLRRAGYSAAYVKEAPCALPVKFVERMLLTQLPEDQEEVWLDYPWVALFDGEKWIPLFPWIKDVQVSEGHNLYPLLPTQYASADRWILEYLKQDENIFKHIGPDGDDTATPLFVRFVQEHLKGQGLALKDIGIHCTPLKRQFSSWEEFPHPKIRGNPQLYPSLGNSITTYTFAKIDIRSRQNPEKSNSLVFPLSLLGTKISSIQFAPQEDKHLLLAHIAEIPLAPLELDLSDREIDISIQIQIPLGTQSISYQKTFSIDKGTCTALCSHFGGANALIASQHYNHFTSEQDENQKLLSLLSFIGASYFEKCGRSQKILASLHKINPPNFFALGLAKLSPDLSKDSFAYQSTLQLPQVDMFFFQAPLLPSQSPVTWHEEIHTARAAFDALFITDTSSNEHQILREIFKDPYAISTVKLLQLAHLEAKKKGKEIGFFTLTASDNFSSFYLNVNPSAQKNTLKSLLEPNASWKDWTYAHITPGRVNSLDGTRQEQGSLIFSPEALYALISTNRLVSHGGLGAPLPSHYLAPAAIRNWELVSLPSHLTHRYTLQFSPTSPSFEKPSLEIHAWKEDVRPWYKTVFHALADPVDIVTGAFYIDETDLILPGSFPLAIRRNYSSQNPLMGDLGCGWKLSLNPYLIKQGDKRFAAEMDGTIIAYRYRPATGRWEVFPEDNPELFNFNQRGIGGAANPFHAYIENDILYGADGSKRFFEKELLQKWVDIRGNTLSFSYKERTLSRIENSTGDFCGFHYHPEGLIAEIYAKDGRRISYDYNTQNDLVRITLPNTATIIYEYDQSHRLIRETRPHDKILENIYDTQNRVTEQRTPAGPQQAMQVTAIFEYNEGETWVTDGRNYKTCYKIYDKQIYKIIDPCGHVTLQSWFINEKTWFDPQTERPLPWNGDGGAIRSLKSTTDKRGLTTEYLYDKEGNIETLTLSGNDLTGDGKTHIAKKFTYNDLQLCTSEEIADQKIFTTYDNLFPHLPKRIETYWSNTLTAYTDFTYNDQGQTVQEDRSGALTLWSYNEQGLPQQKTQLTQTKDPNLITTFSYSPQGQCVKTSSLDGIEEREYDVMGNLIASKVWALTGELLSAVYLGYDLNNALLWKQTANEENIVYFDHHSSGHIKAKRQSLGRGLPMAYTLYDHDPCGNLIEEVNPLGHTTYREYDPVGNLVKETKEDLSTLFTYEPGGFIETITSPSGGKTIRYYTTNGLLKKEIYPDGTSHKIIYDFLSRPIQEIKDDIAWEITHDDAQHRILKTHLSTGEVEVCQFDGRNNLIRFTDAAGSSSEKSYDGLNRIKTETTPSGLQTTWDYPDHRVICKRHNGETTTTHYAAGHVLNTEVTDSQGTLIATSSLHIDPKNDREEFLKGDKKTIIWKNSLGLPLKIETGETSLQHQYDLCGHCTASIDGEGRTTHRKFDVFGRLTSTESPDSSLSHRVYDFDSNLIELHLPNGNTWKATYDPMRRKISETLFSKEGFSNQWEFTYEGGFLKKSTDPLGRTHHYLHDLHGRITHDQVEGGERIYQYDPRGLLLTAEQRMRYPDSHSRVERTYDIDGNLVQESIYLNDALLQQTHQTWTSSSRALQIGEHTRTFLYQNYQLAQVSTPFLDLSYIYELSGALKSTSTPFTSTWIDYNFSGLPETFLTQSPDRDHLETLTWYQSGQLRTHTTPGQNHHFTYHERGPLISSGSENYTFDSDTGVCTEAPHRYVPEGSLDPFNRISTLIFEGSPLEIQYNSLGEIIAYGQQELEWDPWGRLLKVADPSFEWEASYDALNRRLQTRHTKSGGATLTTTSFYDPEKEFEEIGVQIGDQTYWKIYGPKGCDALQDDKGNFAIPIYNALSQLIGITSCKGTFYRDALPSAYGPLEIPPDAPKSLMAYAQSLTWHSKALDPTGFIWMGDRYYDPKTSGFLSPDPISYPLCLDLYLYANGDPINYVDPDGRFSSYAYRSIKPTLLGTAPHFAESLNDFSAYLANHNMTGSADFMTGSIELKHGAIGFINGINNANADFVASLSHLSLQGREVKIHGIYNKSNSVPLDILECIAGHMGFHSTPVQLLINKWNSLIATHSPNAKFLEICHSGGANHVKNALLACPESVRQRIIVLAIAPSVIISKEWCYRSFNYISRRDFVTHLDIFGKMMYGNELHVLEPHPNANFWDHELLSPTFESPIRRFMNTYINEYGVAK